MPHTHTLTVTHTLPMGIADVDGDVQTLVVRRCLGCAYTDAMHGITNYPQQRSQLLSWEVWTAEGVQRARPAVGFGRQQRSSA